MAEGGISESCIDSNCPICLETFSVPRTLPCQHTYCHKCLSDFIVNSVDKQRDKPSFNCPVCQETVHTPVKDKDPKDWAALFPQSTSVLALSEISKTKVHYACDSCLASGDSKKANGFCMDCKEHVCDTCIDMHRKLNILKTHKLLTMEELFQDLSAAINAAVVDHCTIHSENKIEYLCKDHDTLCCVKCFLINHRGCKGVADIKSDVQAYVNEDPSNTLDALKRLEEQLVKFIGKNDFNMKRLENETNDISAVMKKLKDKVINMLEVLEKKIRQEAHQIFKEESIKKSDENHQCQSLLAAVRNSQQLLDAVIRLGNNTQVFITTRQVQGQLIHYRDQVVKKYKKVEFKGVSITLHDSLKTLMSQPGTDLAMVESRNKNEDLFLTTDQVSIKEASCPFGHDDPDYDGATFLFGDNLILIDRKHKTLCLYNPEFQHISHYTMSECPRDVCVVDEEEVAVSVPLNKKIQFLTTTAPLKPTRSINTRYHCSGLVVLNKDELAICGYNDTGNKNYYWSILTTSGVEKHYHEIDSKGTAQPYYSYLAVNKFKTRLYMSCLGMDSVFCFGMDGKLHFSYHDSGLTAPMGIALDRYENIYIVGRSSRNIYQLSPDGILLHVIESEIPEKPQKIAFDRNGLMFLLTNKGVAKQCYIFRLK